MTTTVLAINLIISDPAVRSGRPVIAGTGICVSDIAAATVFHQQSPDEIALGFKLTLAQVYAATPSEAVQVAERQGLAAGTPTREPHPSAGPDEVIWQDPVAGVAVPRGTRVALVVSDGPPPVTVPDVRGFDEVLARRLLAAAGLVVDGGDSVLLKDVPPGVAAGTRPSAGESLRVGRGVTLQLAR